MIHKQEALLLADQEIMNCINNKIITDTSYTNNTGNLTVTRKINTQRNFYTAIVKTTATNNKQQIITLSASYVAAPRIMDEN